MPGIMFAVRGAAVCCSVFALVYCVLSLAVSLGWRAARRYSDRHGERHPANGVADWLFALRLFPLVAAAGVTAAFTIPSFLLLEPRAIDEPVNAIPLALGACGAVLGLFGILNAGLALRRTSRTISAWTNTAQPVYPQGTVPVLRIAPAVPAMVAVGIVRPRVLLSGAAEAMLTAGELQTALKHEVAHVRRLDNLKKLLLRFVAFPGMAALESAWLEATEMASDDAAVANAGEALDLASALIKLSRLGPIEAPVDLTAALVHGAAAMMNARVERLITWSDHRAASQRFSAWYGIAAGLATAAAFAVTYTQLLENVHTATEWLVR